MLVAAEPGHHGVSALLGLARPTDPDGMPYGWHRTPRGWPVAGVNPYGHSRFITIDVRGCRSPRTTGRPT
ncbi:hypothetical protein [Streptomyces avidinii]|uniref:Uncharacterized protein n=1 Tax=Streptomyces avidinii TaxID=1895 RepID=A0ABS4LBD6_STRAV|nr:hypothetical protein [Streptomyces avidinii]MBP2039427.1 hypothetical protein [Streptomyces avidinii]GGZ21382.1 hypothetical protein GCM10010343_56000 [Streptomyces avidinii]